MGYRQKIVVHGLEPAEDVFVALLAFRGDALAGQLATGSVENYAFDFCAS